MLRALWSKRCSLWVELCAARKPKQHARQRGLSRDSSHGSFVTASAAWREERSACSICDERIKTIPTNGSCVRGRVRVRACRAHAAVVTRIRMSLSSSAVQPVCTLLHAIVFRCSFTREQFHRNFMLRCRLQSRNVATALVGSAGTAACEDEGKAACMHLALTESVAKRQSFGMACRVFILAVLGIACCRRLNAPYEHIQNTPNSATTAAHEGRRPSRPNIQRRSKRPLAFRHRPNQLFSNDMSVICEQSN